MYTLSGNTVTFDYTPGWFDEAGVGEMTLKWIDPAGLIGDLTATADAGGTAAPQTGMMTITASDLGYGETMGVHAVYTDWPTVLSSDNSAVNAPNDGWYDGDEDEDTSMAGMFLTLIITIFIVWVVVRILRALVGGYAGGFGTRYVFVNHLWYPAGPDGRPRPGSKGTKRRPRPPRSGGSGFGGGSRGGGFGGGGRERRCASRRLLGEEDERRRVEQAGFMILLHNAEHAGQGGKLLAGHFGGAPGDNDGHAGRFALEAAYGLPCVGHGIGGDGARIEQDHVRLGGRVRTVHALPCLAH